MTLPFSRMDNPECTVPQLMDYIKGPDFPTSATIYGVNGILEAYTTGRGRIKVRSKAEINDEKHQIIITEIPYMVNKSMLIESIANLVKEKKIDGIIDVRDEQVSTVSELYLITAVMRTVKLF